MGSAAGVDRTHLPDVCRRGRPPMPAATMLRIHFMQQWYALSDPAMDTRCTRSGQCAALPGWS
jgi:hypothetical protein